MRLEDFNNGLTTQLAVLTFLSVNGKTLILRRDHDPEDFMYGMHVAPGGKIESGETPEHAARREYFEETDLTLGNICYRGFVLFDNKERQFRGKPAKSNYLVHIFTSTLYSGELKKKDAGTPFWVLNSQLKQLKMEIGDYQLIDILESSVTLKHRVILNDHLARIEAFD
ncbi:MAG: NUDIX domain-containing protein [Nanoarchaeota archaeon]